VRDFRVLKVVVVSKKGLSLLGFILFNSLSFWLKNPTVVSVWAKYIKLNNPAKLLHPWRIF